MVIAFPPILEAMLELIRLDIGWSALLERQHVLKVPANSVAKQRD